MTEETYKLETYYIDIDNLIPSRENPRLPKSLTDSKLNVHDMHYKYFKEQDSPEDISRDLLDPLIGIIKDSLIVFEIKNKKYEIYDGHERYFGLYYVLNEAPEFYTKKIKQEIIKNTIPIESTIPCLLCKDKKHAEYVYHNMAKKKSWDTFAQWRNDRRLGLKNTGACIITFLDNHHFSQHDYKHHDATTIQRVLVDEYIKNIMDIKFGITNDGIYSNKYNNEYLLLLIKYIKEKEYNSRTLNTKEQKRNMIYLFLKETNSGNDYLKKEEKENQLSLVDNTSSQNTNNKQNSAITKNNKSDKNTTPTNTQNNPAYVSDKIESFTQFKNTINKYITSLSRKKSTNIYLLFKEIFYSYDKRKVNDLYNIYNILLRSILDGIAREVLQHPKNDGSNSSSLITKYINYCEANNIEISFDSPVILNRHNQILSQYTHLSRKISTESELYSNLSELDSLITYCISLIVKGEKL